MIILLDGADCTGKTTLAHLLQSKFNAEYIHATWNEELNKDMPGYMDGILHDAWGLTQSGKNVILDRLWLSELVYAEVYRKGSCNPQYGRLAQRVLNRMGVLNIICISPDLEAHKKRFDEVKQRRTELYDNVEQVVELFNHTYFGRNLDKCQMYDTHLKTIINNGGVCEYPNWAYYCIEDHGHQLVPYINEIEFRCRGLSPAQWPVVANLENRNGVGNFMFSDILVVGGRGAGEPWPFHSCSDVNNDLNDFLEKVRVPEHRVFLLNIVEDGGEEMANAWVQHKAYKCPVTPMVMFLGNEAQEIFFTKMEKIVEHTEAGKFQYTVIDPNIKEEEEDHEGHPSNGEEGTA